jgi:hypothetical protein
LNVMMIGGQPALAIMKLLLRLWRKTNSEQSYQTHLNNLSTHQK